MDKIVWNQSKRLTVFENFNRTVFFFPLRTANAATSRALNAKAKRHKMVLDLQNICYIHKSIIRTKTIICMSFCSSSQSDWAIKQPEPKRKTSQTLCNSDLQCGNKLALTQSLDHHFNVFHSFTPGAKGYLTHCGSSTVQCATIAAEASRQLSECPVHWGWGVGGNERQIRGYWWRASTEKYSYRRANVVVALVVYPILST